MSRFGVGSQRKPLNFTQLLCGFPWFASCWTNPAWSQFVDNHALKSGKGPTAYIAGWIWVGRSKLLYSKEALCEISHRIMVPRSKQTAETFLRLRRTEVRVLRQPRGQQVSRVAWTRDQGLSVGQKHNQFQQCDRPANVREGDQQW